MAIYKLGILVEKGETAGLLLFGFGLGCLGGGLGRRSRGTALGGSSGSGSGGTAGGDGGELGLA